MSGSYEGDIVRPLGLVTLYFGYAEVEIDDLLETLSMLDECDDAKRQWSVGRKLAHAQNLLAGLDADNLDELKEQLDDAAVLFDRRNALVHSAIFNSTQVVTSRTSGLVQRVDPDALTALAKQIFSCKERINAGRQRILMPLLVSRRACD